MGPPVPDKMAFDRYSALPPLVGNSTQSNKQLAGKKAESCVKAFQKDISASK